MPFINGRYHVNPIMGAALEAAREAEAAMLASQDHAQRNVDAADNADSTDADATNAPPATAPIHRVEIEASEILPPHSGRATSGFIARIHRSQPQASAGNHAAQMPTKPETHVFSNHGDLLNVLHDALSKP